MVSDAAGVVDGVTPVDAELLTPLAENVKKYQCYIYIYISPDLIIIIIIKNLKLCLPGLDGIEFLIE